MRIIAVLLVIISVFCAVTKFPEDIRAAEKKPIKIAILVWLGYAHSYIAQEKGFFAKYDVDVELILREGYIEVLDLYKNGEADGVFTLLPDVIIMDSEGISVRIVYIPDFFISADGIIGKPEFDSLAGLEGKKVNYQKFRILMRL